MKQEGGKSAKEHVFRVMGRLLSHDLSLRLSRTGAGRKARFPAQLANLISGKYIDYYNYTIACNSNAECRNKIRSFIRSRSVRIIKFILTDL